MGIKIGNFMGNFTQQESLSEEIVNNVSVLLRSGRLHRYNTIGNEDSWVAELEAAYAAYQGSKYCLACTSGGYAMSLALRAFGVKPGDWVLTNSFTLAPVPGAIASIGARTILVEITKDLVIDLHDLEKKIQGSGARVLLLSHMRGHQCDMQKVVKICNAHDVILIEDCAHTMGAKWDGVRSGNFGHAACFSTQTYKHINSGEGGLLVSNDPEFMAKAILMSGSYMFYEKHGAAPDSSYFDQIKLDIPNISGRMDNLRASVLVPQLESLDVNVKRWNSRYEAIELKLGSHYKFRLINRSSQEFFVGSSLQFQLPSFSEQEVKDFLTQTKSLGVDINWFGDKKAIGYTSNYHSWKYLDGIELPQTDSALSRLFDIRIPLTFSMQDCTHVALVILNSALNVSNEGIS